MDMVARAFRFVTVLILAGSSAACATVVRGSNTAWRVQTMPSGATITTSNGRYCEATPCSINMPRKSEFTATVTMPGYKTETIDVGNHISGTGAVAFVGNALIGGILGAGIDLWSGATLDLTPNRSVIPLERQFGSSSLIPYASATSPQAAAYPEQPAPLTPGSGPRAQWSPSPDRPSAHGPTLRMVRITTAQGAAFETYQSSDESAHD